jgi:hypothetical protein
MFLDSGDGVVFKGAVGPWYSEKTRECHMSRGAARELVLLALDEYKKYASEADRVGANPRELFIHGKARFNDDEWSGFQDAVGERTKLVGVRIRRVETIKLYRKGEYPILRGLAFVENENTAYLWTSGFVPRLQSYVGMEVPNPLLVDVCRGDAPIKTVLTDIMALTKLNYNTCKFSSGLPVTLSFADAVGEILTAGPLKERAPLAFKYYI